LREVFVRRGDQNLLDVRFPREARSSGRERVVGFEFDHRPDHDAERRADSFGQLELAPQIRIDPLARLVTSEELVSK